MAFLAWIVLGIASGFIANSKGRNGVAWSVIGLFFGIFALIAAMIVPSKKW